jgi:hypothetical protein
MTRRKEVRYLHCFSSQASERIAGGKAHRERSTSVASTVDASLNAVTKSLLITSSCCWCLLHPFALGSEAV